MIGKRHPALTLAVAMTIIANAVSAAAAQMQPERGRGVLAGDRFYCEDRKLGTWFYCDRPRPEPVQPVEPVPPARTSAEKLEAVTAELRELKARAILEPTRENVTAYIRYQRAQLDRASLFGDVWQRAIWQTPELDYTLERPVGTVAKQQWIDARKAERDRALDRLGERYGLFYFFAQSCGACRVMSPIVKSVADTHRLAVRAISTDGSPSETFPGYTVETNHRPRMGLTARTTPAVVLFDSQTRTAIPISYGIIAADDLMERIFQLTQRKTGSDY